MRVDAEEQFHQVRQFLEERNMATTTKQPLLLSSPAAVTAYLDQHDIQTVLFDCDGVLYRSPAAAPGAVAALHNLLTRPPRQTASRKTKKKNVFFVTNNSAANPAQLQEKLCHILQLNNNDENNNNQYDSGTSNNGGGGGSQGVVLTQDMMISTAWTTAQYLKQQYVGHSRGSDSNDTPRVYVIGSRGLCEEIERAGLDVISADEDDNASTTTSNGSSSSSMSREELAAYDFDALGTVCAVVVGHDTDFHFRKLCIANVLLQRHPDAALVATNLDAFDLVGGDGRHLPGNGSLVQALHYASGRPVVDCGKPSPILVQLLQDVYGVDCRRSMFVGDRLDTDIQFALDTGMHAALVMTGVTTAQTLQDTLLNRHMNNDENNNREGQNDKPVPTVIFPHVGYLAGDV